MTELSDRRLTRALNWCEEKLGTRLEVEPAAADASSRRYFRITETQSNCQSHHQQGFDPTSYILMDAPNLGPSTAAFVRVGEMLRRAGINSPQIIAADYRKGLLILSDLGRTTYLDALSTQACHPEPLFAAAITTLVKWQTCSRPARLPEFTSNLLQAELDLFTDWYLKRHCDIYPSASEQRVIDTLFKRITEQLIHQPQVYVHRDYMPRNLMLANPLPGVLDYQDAVIGPASYDPVCLYRDAFLSWPQGMIYAGLHSYWQQARRAGIPLSDDFERFWIDCQWTSLQRHFKVIGTFARLAYRDSKEQYLRDVPRFFDYLRSSAELLDCQEDIEFIIQLANSPER